MIRAVGLLLLARNLVLHLLTALFGTAIIASELSHIFHPQAIRGVFIRELVISASVAFLLGSFVYYKWKPPEAKWLWIAGACGFAWRVILGSPQTIHEEVGWLTLGLVSLRVVSYSFGALCYESLAPFFQTPTVELREAQSNPIQPTADP